MKEHIEREALPKKKERGFFLDDNFNAGWNACLNAIDFIPAADVRPVVFCKDCEFWQRERISCEGVARCNTGEGGIRFRAPYDFCSRGVRINEGADND